MFSISGAPTLHQEREATLSLVQERRELVVKPGKAAPVLLMWNHLVPGRGKPWAQWEVAICQAVLKFGRSELHRSPWCLPVDLGSRKKCQDICRDFPACRVMDPLPHKSVWFSNMFQAEAFKQSGNIQKKSCTCPSLEQESMRKMGANRAWPFRNNEGVCDYWPQVPFLEPKAVWVLSPPWDNKHSVYSR